MWPKSCVFLWLTNNYVPSIILSTWNTVVPLLVQTWWYVTEYAGLLGIHCDHYISTNYIWQCRRRSPGRNRVTHFQLFAHIIEIKYQRDHHAAGLSGNYISAFEVQNIYLIMYKMSFLHLRRAMWQYTDLYEDRFWINRAMPLEHSSRWTVGQGVEVGWVSVLQLNQMTVC